MPTGRGRGSDRPTVGRHCADCTGGCRLPHVARVHRLEHSPRSRRAAEYRDAVSDDGAVGRGEGWGHDERSGAGGARGCPPGHLHRRPDGSAAMRAGERDHPVFQVRWRGHGAAPVLVPHPSSLTWQNRGKPRRPHPIFCSLDSRCEHRPAALSPHQPLSPHPSPVTFGRRLTGGRSEGQLACPVLAKFCRTAAGRRRVTSVLLGSGSRTSTPSLPRRSGRPHARRPRTRV